MANYATLKAAIQQVIKANGNNEITGSILQSSLVSMITSLGANYQFAGVVTPSSMISTPDQNIFYIASEPGYYSGVNATLIDGEVAIFAYNGSWSKLATNIASLTLVEGVRNDLARLIGFTFETDLTFSSTGTRHIMTGYSVPAGMPLKVTLTSNDAEWTRCAVFGNTNSWANAQWKQDNMQKGTTYTIVANVNITDVYLFVVNYSVAGTIHIKIELDRELIPDYSLGLEKLNFTSSKNLIDKNAPGVQPGYYQTGQAPVANASYTLSDYIPIEPGETYTCSVNGSQTAAIRFHAYFDESRNYLSGSSGAAVSQITPPNNAKFVRISVDTNAYWSKNIMLEKGVTVSAYEPFRLTINYDALPPIIIPDESITTPKIAGSAVTMDKTNFFASSNLVNRNDPDVMLGYFQTGANPTANADYNLTGYIPVEVGKHYVMGAYSLPANARFLAKFDANKTFLSYVSYATEYTGESGVAFVRLSIHIRSWEVFKMEEGDTVTPYSDYKLQLKPELAPPMQTPEVCLARKAYIYDGHQNNVYFRNICRWFDNRLIGKVTGWTNQGRCARTQGTTDGLQMAIVSNDNDLTPLIGISATTVRGLSTTSTGQLKVNIIGDSFTYNGKYTQQIATLCPNLTCVGMRKPYNISNNAIRSEGRGGWSLGTYCTKPFMANYYEGFSPFLHPANYTYYGVVQFWADIVNDNIGSHTYDMKGYDDVKTRFGTNGYLLSPSVNDMMYDYSASVYKYWNGSSWVNYSGTPTFVFDYAKYIAAWGITSPDYVVIMLGVNDFANGYTDDAAQAYNARMQTVIASIQAYATAQSKTIKIALCTNTVICGLPYNNTGRFVADKNHYLFSARKNMIKTFDTAEQETNHVYLVDTGAVLDPDYGFSEVEVLPFEYYTGNARELYCDNYVHPGNGGYQQLGTCIAGFIQATR